MVVFAGLTLVAVAALLWAEYRTWRLGVWIAKPLASSGFVGAAIAAGALETRYGQAILCALGLSWFGDVLLILRAPIYFQAGLFSFLFGHLVFAGALVFDGVAPLGVGGALALLAMSGMLFGRWIWPHTPRALRGPVGAYIVIISLMVACAIGHFGHHKQPVVALAALAFYFSDLAVARDRTVAPGFVNRVWGLPLYYGAQLLFAASVMK